MSLPFLRPLAAAALLAALPMASVADGQSFTDAAAEQIEGMLSGLQSREGYWRVLASPYTLHFRPSDEHEPVWALGVERQLHNRWLWGAAFFSNSFGQPSGYGYFGRQHPGVLGLPPSMYVQWSVGLMYGYKGQYEDKVPLNYRGLSPGALLGLGWQATPRFALQVNLLGDAGAMFQLSYRLE